MCREENREVRNKWKGVRKGRRGRREAQKLEDAGSLFPTLETIQNTIGKSEVRIYAAAKLHESVRKISLKIALFLFFFF